VPWPTSFRHAGVVVPPVDGVEMKWSRATGADTQGRLGGASESSSGPSDRRRAAVELYTKADRVPETGWSKAEG
jgi:hypothetical protein